jgi:hypothetical protein
VLTPERKLEILPHGFARNGQKGATRPNSCFPVFRVAQVRGASLRLKPDLIQLGFILTLRYSGVSSGIVRSPG